MAYVEKLARLFKLAGILGLSVGSMIISACGGRSGGDTDNQNHQGYPDAAALDSTAADAGVDSGANADGAVDGSVVDGQVPDGNQPQSDAEQPPPDAQLWDVICE